MAALVLQSVFLYNIQLYETVKVPASPPLSLLKMKDALV